jgi:hypothetical protein
VALMDAVSIAVAVATFVILLALIRALEKI